MRKLLVYLPLALALTAGPPLAANESDRYGAFAIDVDVWAYAFAGGERTQDEADEAALSLCAEEGAERCEITYQYTGSRCGAAAIAEERDYLAWGFGHADNRAEAIDEAISACKSENTSGAACRKMSVACGALHPADDPQRALKKAEREQRKAERALKKAERKLEKEQAARQKAQTDLKAAQSEQKKAAREQRKAERDLKAAQTAQQTAQSALKKEQTARQTELKKWKEAWKEEKTGREWAEYYLKQAGGDPAQAQAAAKGQAGKKGGGWNLDMILGVANLAVGNTAQGMTHLALASGDDKAAEAIAKRHMAAELGVSTATMDSVFDALDTPAEQTAQAGPQAAASGPAPQVAQAGPQAAAGGPAQQAGGAALYGYGAYAFDEAMQLDPAMAEGVALGKPSQAKANQVALEKCRTAGGSRCILSGATTKRCVAKAFREGRRAPPGRATPVGVGAQQNEFAAVGFGEADTLEAAEAQAMAKCRNMADQMDEVLRATMPGRLKGLGTCQVSFSDCAGDTKHEPAPQQAQVADAPPPVEEAEAEQVEEAAPQGEDAEAEEDSARYGSWAINPEQMAYALAVGYETQKEADQAAWGLCNDVKARGENFCENGDAINAKCVAIAKVTDGEWRRARGRLVEPGIGTGDTKAGAIETAIFDCQDKQINNIGERPSCSLHSAVCAPPERPANIRGRLDKPGEEAIRDRQGHLENLLGQDQEAGPEKEKEAAPANKEATETPEIFRDVSKGYKAREEATE